MITTSEDTTIKSVYNGNSEVDEVDNIDITNIWSIKINFQSKTTKSKNIVYTKKLKIGFVIFRVRLVFIKLK